LQYPDNPRYQIKKSVNELELVQFGGMPKDAKPFKGVGSGVFEIALAYETNAFRAGMHRTTWKKDLCPACGTEGVKVGHQDATEEQRSDQTEI
jgi:hypothetical protein